MYELVERIGEGGMGEVWRAEHHRLARPAAIKIIRPEMLGGSSDKTERLLRRFRYQLINRITRFPRPYFRNTSQGELVSMVTSEAEPMGGLMGDMLAQPVFQAGQMLTILTFLFAQSIWFGLASIALIPLQAWLIPMLQRQINLLNKERIKEVRNLATEIGETASAVSDIRTNGGLRYRMALFSHRLGSLFDIRFEIYQKKFFMKFLNNFINQITPFFFYSVGGYLAIKGEITVGALFAALAAYKDLSSPWKELLSYYNQAQDMALRWTVVTDRFAPATLVDDSLFDGEPDAPVSLRGEIKIDGVTVRDEDGNSVLEDITLSIPPGARVAVKTDSEIAARAFADLLTREVVPQHGHITIAGHDINSLHQVSLVRGIGYAHSNPELLQGTLGDNLLLPFKRKPLSDALDTPAGKRFHREATRSGNTADNLEAKWVDASLAGFESTDDVKEWWFQLVEAMGIDEFMVRRALRSPLDPAKHRKLTEEIIRLRPEIANELEAAGVSDVVNRFHPDKFNPDTPLGSNLLYALPDHMLTQRELAEDQNFVRMLRNEGVAEELAQLATQLLEGLMATFGKDGTDHPLFRRLNMDDELYSQLSAIVKQRRTVGDSGLTPEDYALMLTVPFAFSADQIGPAVDEAFIQRVLDIRKQNATKMIEAFSGQFEAFDPQRYIPVMTLLGNAIFGTVSQMAGAREKVVEDTVVNLLKRHGL
ncbi:MAG: ABC transporter transmembrane domain-containing protein, partial [Pseudomonadota bacterium]